MGTASYPAIGGALATLGWFFPFYLSLLAIPAGLFVLFGLENPEPDAIWNRITGISGQCFGIN
ncbi:MAG: hypothetical protein U5K69_26295 [Balneolaceae bacterium]|nr:hypothetical protein [Balneolaceae bacterium]